MSAFFLVGSASLTSIIANRRSLRAGTLKAEYPHDMAAYRKKVTMKRDLIGEFLIVCLFSIAGGVFGGMIAGFIAKGFGI